MINIQHKDGVINAYILVSIHSYCKPQYEEIFNYILSNHKHNYNFVINIIYKNGETLSTNLFGLAHLGGYEKELEDAITDTLLEVDRYSKSTIINELKHLIFNEGKL